MAIKAGDKVKVDYTGTLDDGTVFDSSEKHGNPLEFEVGSGMVIKGFDDAVMGLEVGAEKDFRLEPAEAYGDINPQLLKKVPRDKLPTDHELKAGMMLAMGLPDGRQLPARIAELDETEVTIDLNHPLAGKALNFRITVKEIN